MLDYRDIVDYVLIVFKKKQLDTIDEDKEWSISDIIEKAATGESVPAKAVVGTKLINIGQYMIFFYRPI